MSIGKSAMKRVANNGYSAVNTSAPDMENSNVITAPAQEVVEKLIAPIEKKTATRKAPVKKAKTEKVTAKTTKNGFERYAFGEELPYYLL